MKQDVFTESERREIASRYSLADAIANLCGDNSKGRYEREIEAELNRRCDRPGKTAGFSVPDFILSSAARAKRTGSSMTYANSTSLVPTDLLADDLVVELAPQTILGKAGIDIIAGLRGDVAIPKMSKVSAGWIVEDAAAPAVAPETEQITASPHTVSATITFSRRLMLQSAVAVDRIVSAAIVDAIGRAIEAAAFVGTGADGQPTGLANVTGVQSGTIGASPTKAELVALWSALLAENVPTDRLAWVGSPAVYASLCQAIDAKVVSAEDTPVGVATAARYLCENGRSEGFPFHVSNLCGDGLWLGDFSQAAICAWSGVDLKVDPFTLSTTGAVRITAFKDCDIVCKNPEAFVKATVSAD